LLVKLPTNVDISAATEGLSRFGDVADVQVLTRAAKLTVISVAFFDVRAAANARSALGAKHCQLAPQTGRRTVRLPGSVQLEQDNIKGVSCVNPDPTDSGAYLVEFFDTRDATLVQELAAQAEAPHAPPGRVQRAVPTFGPAYVRPSRGFGVAAASAVAPRVIRGGNKVPQGRCEGENVTVLLESLPKALCTGPCMEAMLEQAGLAGAIVSCKVRRGGSACKSILLTLRGRDAAQHCVSHFHGQRWHARGASVDARILGDDLAMARSCARSSMDVQVPVATVGPLLGKPQKEQDFSAATDESTADGASDASEPLQEERAPVAPVARRHWHAARV